MSGGGREGGRGGGGEREREIGMRKMIAKQNSMYGRAGQLRMVGNLVHFVI